MPETFRELTGIFAKLERHYRDMQDIEFTVQEDVLWMLQTRNGKRTTKAALKIAVDPAREQEQVLAAVQAALRTAYEAPARAIGAHVQRSAVIAGAVAWRTKNVLATVAAGMAALWFVTWLT